MGPRARRRAAHVGVASLVIGVAVTSFLVTHTGRSSPDRSSRTSQPSKEVYGTFGAFGVSYGTHRTELLARFGEPDQKRNSCWIYRVSRTSFHGIKLNPQTVGMDAVRYCFYGGAVAIIENHWPPGIRNHSQSGKWLAPLTYGCGGGPCISTV